MQEKKIEKLGQFITLGILSCLIFGVSLAGLTGLAYAQEGDDDQDEDEAFFGLSNVVVNGNFEDGFYPVPGLGFEPPDVGQVPIGWEWFKNDAYGKYTIQNQEGFGLVCPADAAIGFPDFGALAIHMQSTDQQDARLGVYQTVDVVPGVDYLFSISGTVQSMQGSPEKSEDSHKVELVFDQSGGDDWRAIPNEEWTRLPWSEYDLEFKVSGPDDPDLATIEDYKTVVRARSNKMTIFLAAYRKWPDWRYVRYTFDCVSLIPLNEVPASMRPGGETPAAPVASANGAQPAAITSPGDSQPDVPAADSPAIIPDSGGVPEKNLGTTILITSVSLFILFGLIGAGVWNIRRKS